MKPNRKMMRSLLTRKMKMEICKERNSFYANLHKKKEAAKKAKKEKHLAGACK